ncbi:hypothetical protein [Hymenobacter lucidus]|uniref:Macroglobulin domain-containing protein n=1 Tax=Hymenobacter lucidus TaxID=2880930 RepID=A0ABS8AR14_9BACT|nr:hypothetical protein [Hymenobacter lucidus]MCB2408657.1 hypothetical protein [Hymenobacter lucidus]
MKPAAPFSVTQAALRVFAGGLLCTFAAGSAYGQTDSLRTISRQLSRYSQHRLPEKLFLHVDRPFYVVGEIMWFKVYAVDGVFHKPMAVSKIAYVELVDKAQKPVLQGKIALDKATGQGSFVLPKGLASGTYTIRAYTNWMKNSAPEFYFHSAITIVNTFGSVTIKPAQEKAEYDAQFFPEGGNLVKGLPSTVAFKIADQLGKGIDAAGIIVDQRGTNVAQFKTLKFGLGSFSFTPTEAGTSYSAVITLPGGQTVTRKLPGVAEKGYVMHLSNDNAETLTVSVRTNSADDADDILLLGHARHIPSVSAIGRFKNNQAVFSVRKNELAEGISHFTVFSAQKQPLCERLYFRNPGQKLNVSVKTDKATYTTREKVSLQVATTNPAAQATPAALSLAVYRLDSLANLPSSNINSYLWLASDVKGRIENPDYYFSTAPEAEQAADNLMLTQGWSRFRWTDVLAAKTPEIKFYPETSGHWIQGKLTKSATGQPAPNVPVYLSSPSRQARLYNCISKPDGTIQFEMRDFYGPKEIIVQNNTQLDSSYRAEIYSPFSAQYAAGQVVPFKFSEFFRPEIAQRHVQSQLQTAYYKKLNSRYKLPANDSVAFYGKPDETYLLDAFTRFKVMEEVMREYVPGVLVRIRKDGFHFQVMDHLNKTVMVDNPMVLLDGVPIFDIDKVVALDPLKIQKLEVITSNYFHGREVYRGLVSYTTYKGDLGSYKLDPHALLQEYEGLQLQREFYSPRYETDPAKQSRQPDFRNLLYWNPDVTTSAGRSTELDFYTADQPGKYLVVVQGMTANGHAGSTRYTFEVKQAL